MTADIEPYSEPYRKPYSKPYSKAEAVDVELPGLVLVLALMAVLTTLVLVFS